MLPYSETNAAAGSLPGAAVARTNDSRRAMATRRGAVDDEGEMVVRHGHPAHMVARTWRCDADARGVDTLQAAAN